MHPVKGQPIKLVIQVPTNVTLSTNVHIQTADADPGVAAPFARCAPSGCFVDFELKDDMVKKFRAASGNGKITYADVTGHEVAVSLSLAVSIRPSKRWRRSEHRRSLVAGDNFRLACSEHLCC